MATATQPRPAAPVDPAQLEFSDILAEHLRAGYQMLYIPTSEEARVERAIAAVCLTQHMNMITWDVFEGFNAVEMEGFTPPNEEMRKPKYKDVIQALITVDSYELANPNTVFIFRDLDDMFANPVVRRAIRSLCEANRLVNDARKRPIIVTSPSLTIHPKLRACVAVVDFKLPGEETLEETFTFVQRAIQVNDAEKARCSDELKERLIGTMRGLTSNEAENALSRASVRHRGFCEEMLHTLKEEKASIIAKSEVLTYLDESAIVDRKDIGGFENLIEFVERRKMAYTRAARVERIDFPKGFTLVGVPGTGKSVVAAAVGKILGMPVYTLDVGAVFGSLVGESESRMRDALRTVTAQQGCVLLLDEADKAFGGAADSTGDSGVTRRVFGQMLTWLAGKNDRTFVIMTMNRTAGIPPEFLRAGRFDAVFYTDMPTTRERREILEIHFRKRGVDVAALGFDEKQWEQLITDTKGFVGSELEEIVRESRYTSFAKRGSGIPNFDEVQSVQATMVPLSKLDAVGIKEIRDWCHDRARPVSRPERAARTPRTRGIQTN